VERDAKDICENTITRLVPVHGHGQKESGGKEERRRTCVIIRVGQLLAGAHTDHPATFALPHRAFLDIPTEKLVDLIRLDVITDVLPVRTQRTGRSRVAGEASSAAGHRGGADAPSGHDRMHAQGGRTLCRPWERRRRRRGGRRSVRARRESHPGLGYREETRVRMRECGGHACR